MNIIKLWITNLTKKNGKKICSCSVGKELSQKNTEEPAQIHTDLGMNLIMVASETVYIFEYSCSKSKGVRIHHRMLKKMERQRGILLAKIIFKNSLCWKY